jgi:ankyrin repeat protein
MMIDARGSADPLAALFDAIRQGDVSAASGLLDESPSLASAAGPGGLPPLLFAAYCRQGAMVELLLARAAALDLPTAAALGRLDRVRALLAESPSLVSSLSPDGWTPLHLAAHFGQRAVMELLLEHGADAEARSNNGLVNTALHAAVAGGALDAVELLLARGADADAVQQGGYTPLHAAAQNGSLPICERLLAAGASPNLRSDHGQTALSFASERGHTAVTDLLREHGGEL